MNPSPAISIIIPTYNEARHIGSLLSFLTTHQDAASFDVLVVDGGSTDETRNHVEGFDQVRLIESEVKSRAMQLNRGAQLAKHPLLYFVHADVVLPDDFNQHISKVIQSADAGCFRYQFDSHKWLLKVNAFFTRLPMLWCRGGDQTLFVRKEVFNELGGFNPYYSVMEDFDLVKRLMSTYTFKVIPQNVIVSARKYDHNSYLKVQWENFMAFRSYSQGKHPDQIKRRYKEKLNLHTY